MEARPDPVDGADALANVDELLRRQAAAQPGSVALIAGDERLTWAELDDLVERLASGFSGLGVVAGHRVAIAVRNGVPFVAAYLATLRCGLVAVPISPTLVSADVADVLADSGARVCLADRTALWAVQAALAADRSAGPKPLLVTVGSPPAAGEIGYDDLPTEGSRVLTPRDAEAIAVLLYTPGTSGRPRAAMLSHRALLANIQQCAATDPPPMLGDDVVLGALPLSHVYGLNAVLGQVLWTGATLVLAGRLDPEQALQLIAREAVTCVPAAPPLIAAWSGSPLAARSMASVRILLSGAGALAEETVRDFEQTTGLKVEQGYGLTEAGPVLTSTIGSPRHKPGSAGRALPGVELRVVDEDGADVDPADTGEIRARGANLFSGYWPDGDAAPDPEGWLATGDIGYLDAEGDLFLVDRLAELIVVSGFNVYPSEVEDVIRDVPGVAQCAVIGEPDAAGTGRVVAYVVAAGDLDAAELTAAVTNRCRTRLARFKLPAEVRIVADLPMTPTGKVARGRLRAQRSRHELGLL